MRSDEDGFTLIELLISTTIVGIVLTAVFGSIILYFNTTADTTDRLSESPSLQIVSSWFGTDAESSAASTSPTHTAYDQACDAPASPSPLVSFSWVDPGPDTKRADDRYINVSYVVATSSDNVHQKVLSRYSCIATRDSTDTTFTTFNASVAQPTITVMNFVSPLAADTPQLLCDGAAAAACTTATKTVAITFAMCSASENTPIGTDVCKRASVAAEVQGHRRVT